MAKSDYYMVIESFVGTLKGKELEYQKGEVLAAGDPAVAKWPHLFGPLVIRQSTPAVEQATAAPGEKRKLTLRRAKPRKATAAEEAGVAATISAEAKAEPRKATPAEEAGVAATVAAEAKAEPEAPAGKPLTLGSFKPGG